jgi:hypothetical protein
MKKSVCAALTSLALLVCAALIYPQPTLAQQVLPGGPPPAVCAYNASLPSLSPGFVYLQCDIHGQLLVAGGGGGGGGAVTLAAGSVSSGAYVAGALADGAITTLGTEADAAWTTGSGTGIALLKAVDRDINILNTTAGNPLPPRAGSMTQAAVSVTNASTALLTAAQFTNFEKVCVALTATTGIWVNWAGVAAVTAPPSEYIPPGQCDNWIGSTGYMPTAAAFAISNSAATISATVEGN